MSPVRVLHVLGAMNRGGVETWLMHVLRHIDRRKFQLDFLVHTAHEAAYDTELQALGALIFRAPNPSNPASYAGRFFSAAGRGRYDAVHSHVHHYSGYVLLLARMAGIPIRIAHSHNDTSVPDAQAGWRRNIYLRQMRRLIASQCTLGLAVSREAAESLYGVDWMRDPRFRIHYCGIEVEDGGAPVDHAAIRAEFHFQPDDLVIGHVGRFTPQKNHAFLIETAAEMMRMHPAVKLLLVGGGPLRQQIEERVRALGIENRVAFAGLRADVPRLMRGAMDLMLLPSLHEGLPLVLLEAQAAGLRSLVANGVTREAVIASDLVSRLPLEAGPQVWAATAIHSASAPRLDGRAASERFRASPFHIDRAVRDLCAIYSPPGQSIRPERRPAAILAGRDCG